MSQALVAMIALGLGGQIDPSNATKAGVDQNQQKKWNAYYESQAATYEIRREGSPTPLELKSSPVLFWSNPVRIGDTNGAVFIWTDAGRAEAVGTIFSFLDRKNSDLRIISHSFHSLSLKPLAAVREGRPSWSISAAGIEPKPIPDSPQPAGTASLRLAQMREMTRDFTATTRQDGVERELRLLPQPIHRNPSDSGATLDGALFTFVMGTDPELMLLLEVRKTNTGPVWHYAPARFTDLSIKLRHKQREIWSHEGGSAPRDGKSPYVSGRVGTHPSVIQ